MGSPGCPGSKTGEISSVVFVMFNLAGFVLHFCILHFWGPSGWMANGDGAGLVVEAGPSAAWRWFSVPWWLVFDMRLENSFSPASVAEGAEISE